MQIDLEGLPEADAAAVRDAWRDALASPTPADHARATPPVIVAQASTDRNGMLADLSQRVTLAALERRRGDLWMLHAAGLAGDDGRVVVLVGPSGRGKTTAARALAATFGYVSDESVAIDDDGRVWPYRKPLSVIEQRGVPKTQRPPSELGLRPLPDAALRVAAIVLLDRRDDAPEQPALETVDLGDALKDLVSQSSGLTSMPAPLRSIALLTSATGGIRRVTYRESSSLRPVIDALLAEPGPEPSPAAASARGPLFARRAVGGAVEPAAGGPADGELPRYSRAPFVDALDLADPDRIAVLRSGARGEGTLHVLAGVAPAIWRAADAASVHDLTAAATDAFGVPDGDAGALVGAAVDELVDAGVLGTDRP